MTKEVTMPRLSETMPEGKILVWYKKTDEKVDKGDVIAEVETDKANMEIEAVDSGILSEILVSEGESAKVGDPIAVLNGKQEKTGKKKEVKEEKSETTDIEEPKKSEEILESKKPGKTAEKTDFMPEIETGTASLLVKNLAKQMNVDLSQIKGTGPNRQIKKSDIINAAKKNGKEEIQLGDTVSGEKIPLNRVRKTISKRMTYSKQTTPHFYITNEVDADNLTEYHKNQREKIEGLTYNDIFIKAIAIVLKDYPQLNASFKENCIDLKQEINIGIGLANEKGLIVPVVHQADKKSLKEIRVCTKTIKERVKNNKLRPEDMSGGTFTISNLGMYGIKEFIAIVNPPESAGVAIGSIQKAPVVKNGEIKAGYTVMITLSGDHRVFDGADGASYMKDLKEILENPEKIEKN